MNSMPKWQKVGYQSNGRASAELHELLDRVVVSYDQDAKNHILDMQGYLITLPKEAKPAEAAGIEGAKSSLKLVAGGRNHRCRTQLKCQVTIKED